MNNDGSALIFFLGTMICRGAMPVAPLSCELHPK